VSTQFWAGLAVIRTAAKNQVSDASAQCCLESQGTIPGTLYQML